MTTTPPATPEELHQLFDLDRSTGRLYHRARTPAMFTPTGRQSAEHRCALWNGRWAGKEAFTALSTFGTRQGSIHQRVTHAHRVIWAMVHGHWPEADVLHRNGVLTDNRPTNLYLGKTPTGDQSRAYVRASRTPRKRR